MERGIAPAWPGLRRNARVLIAFARPHTVVGTVASLAALFVLARRLPVDATPGVGDLVLTLTAGLGVNVFIVGLNQLTDVELDRVNKPWLPLPAGILSVRHARLGVLVAMGVALAAALAAGPWLLAAIVLAGGIGAAYSLQPLRLKRHHVLAAGAIVGVRGLVVNLVVFVHFVDAGGGAPRCRRRCWSSPASWWSPAW